MRLHILSGVALALTASIAVVLGAFFGLELDSVALLGIALGAVVGLVPQGRPIHRLIGFGAGFAIVWAGYATRAAVLPDSTSGRAVAALVVVLACTLVYLVARGAIPLWSPLVGVAALVGAYEETYTAAPSQFVDQSLSAATTVLLAAAIGYLVSALFATEDRSVERTGRTAAQQRTLSIDELMTESAR
jgi:hypothetical protein